MKDCMNEKDMRMTLLQATNLEGWSDDKFIVEVQQMWEPIVDLRYSEMKKAQWETKDRNKEKKTFLAQRTNTTAETIKLFEANQLKDRHKHDSYITVAAIEKGLKVSDHDIAIAEKGLTDNDSSD